MAQLIDCHAHVQFRAFRNDADEVIQRAREAGVKMIVPSSELKTAKRGVEYAEKYPEDIRAAVGLHPIHLKPNPQDSSESAKIEGGTRFREKEWRPLAEHPRTVAIGEIGFDYAERFQISGSDRILQEETFRQQIELALSVGKPIIVHCRSGKVDGSYRDAQEDALRILIEYVPRGLRGVIHCYSGNLDQARRCVDLGFALSFTGLITFVDQWDEVIRCLSPDRILVETDSPYMTPVPYRGTRNEPAYVRYVVEKIAALKNFSFEDIAAQTTQNAQKLFKLS